MMQAGNQLCSVMTGGNEHDQVLEQDTVLIGQILESDIWLEVASRMLKRCDTLQHLNNSSLFFRNLFGLFQTTHPCIVNFEPAFEILVENTLKINGPADFPLHDILNCRQVCKQWNTAVDKLLINKWKHRSDRLGRQDLSNSNHQNVTHVFDLLSHFESTHSHQSNRNPFMRGDITLLTSNWMSQDLEYNRFLEGISSILSKFGNHIENFMAFGMGYSRNNDFIALSNWLAQMPKLKHLRIFNSYIPMDDPNNFENLLVVAPYPNLKRLESLHVSHFPNTLLCGLIKQNNHICELQIDKSFHNERISFSLFPPLPNLNTLQLYSPENISSLLNSKIQCANLRFLTLTRTSGAESVRWSNMFEMIETNFANSLETLFVREFDSLSDDKREQSCQDSIHCRLYMPKLREIELYLKNPISLDFLLTLKDTLEILRIRNVCSIIDYLPFLERKTVIPLQVLQSEVIRGKELKCLLYQT